MRAASRMRRLACHRSSRTSGFGTSLAASPLTGRGSQDSTAALSPGIACSGGVSSGSLKFLCGVNNFHEQPWRGGRHHNIDGESQVADGERTVISYVSSLFVLVICLDYGGKNSTHD